MLLSCALACIVWVTTPYERTETLADLLLKTQRETSAMENKLFKLKTRIWLQRCEQMTGMDLITNVRIGVSVLYHLEARNAILAKEIKKAEEQLNEDR